MGESTPVTLNVVFLNVCMKILGQADFEHIDALQRHLTGILYSVAVMEFQL